VRRLHVQGCSVDMVVSHLPRYTSHPRVLLIIILAVMIAPGLIATGLFCCVIQVAVYRVSQEEWTKLRDSVPYVKLYRYNPKHLYPKLNGYGDNGQRSLKL